MKKALFYSAGIHLLVAIVIVVALYWHHNIKNQILEITTMPATIIHTQIIYTNQLTHHKNPVSALALNSQTIKENANNKATTQNLAHKLQTQHATKQIAKSHVKNVHEKTTQKSQKPANISSMRYSSPQQIQQALSQLQQALFKALSHKQPQNTLRFNLKLTISSTSKITQVYFSQEGLPYNIKQSIFNILKDKRHLKNLTLKQPIEITIPIVLSISN